MSQQILFQLINAPKYGKELLIKLAEKNPDIKFINVTEYIAGTNLSTNQFITTCNFAIIIANRYSVCKSIIKARLSNRINYNPNMTTLVFIGDVAECRNGFISISTWEDIKCFGDSTTLYILKQEEEEIMYRTKLLLQQPLLQDKLTQFETFNNAYNKICDEVLTASNGLIDYDIEVSTQTVAYLKKHCWTNGDKETEFAYPRETICHTEERLAYKQQQTMYDILIAWLSLQYYKQLGIAPMKKVYTNGVDFLIPDSEDETEYLVPTPIFTSDTLEE